MGEVTDVEKIKTLRRRTDLGIGDEDGKYPVRLGGTVEG